MPDADAHIPALSLDSLSFSQINTTCEYPTIVHYALPYQPEQLKSIRSFLQMYVMSLCTLHMRYVRVRYNKIYMLN